MNFLLITSIEFSLFPEIAVGLLMGNSSGVLEPHQLNE
jgi:hypothetical protein